MKGFSNFYCIISEVLRLRWIKEVRLEHGTRNHSVLRTAFRIH